MENQSDKIEVQVVGDIQDTKPSMLLKQPDEYAKEAIQTLETQLLTARGSNKILKLKSRIEKWKTVLKVLSEQEPKLQEVERKFDEMQQARTDTPSMEEISKGIAQEINSLLLEPDTMKNVINITSEE
jgi:hypothetical protein